MGPWSHIGRTTGLVLGNIRFGSNTTGFYQQTIEVPFWYCLKEKAVLNNC